MKKRLIFAFLLTASLFALTACSGQSGAGTADGGPVTEDTTDAADDVVTDDAADATEIALTMRAVLDANSAETLFQTYSNILKTYQYPDDADGRRVSEYADADMMFTDYGYEQDLFFRDGSNSYIYEEERQAYSAILEFDFNPSYFDYPAFSEDLTLQEEIVSVTEDGDTISLVTRFSMEAFRPYFAEGDFPYEEGDYMEEAYILNASDCALLQEKATLVRADGSREEQETVTITYDAPTPERVADLLAHKNATDVRTGTITLDPNTPEERSVSVNAQKGDYILLYMPEGYETFYSDPECTIVDEGSDEPDLNADFHLYSVRSEA